MTVFRLLGGYLLASFWVFPRCNFACFLDALHVMSWFQIPIPPVCSRSVQTSLAISLLVCSVQNSSVSHKLIISYLPSVRTDTTVLSTKHLKSGLKNVLILWFHYLKERGINGKQTCHLHPSHSPSRRLSHPSSPFHPHLPLLLQARTAGPRGWTRCPLRYVQSKTQSVSKAKQ